MDASTSTPNERCPRCGGGFHCGAGESRCDCFELRLSEALRAELAARYPSCLCLACLRELASEPRSAALSSPNLSSPGQSG